MYDKDESVTVTRLIYDAENVQEQKHPEITTDTITVSTAMYEQVCAERDSLKSMVSELVTQNGALNDECKETKRELAELKIKYDALRKSPPQK